MNLTGELKGKYYGLHGSQSNVAMDEAKEEELRNNGNLFQEPDSTLLLASGCGRHWLIFFLIDLLNFGETMCEDVVINGAQGRSLVFNSIDPAHTGKRITS